MQRLDGAGEHQSEQQCERDRHEYFVAHVEQRRDGTRGERDEGARLEFQIPRATAAVRAGSCLIFFHGISGFETSRSRQHGCHIAQY